ncbi:MAG: cell division protein SepF [Selenomonadaceae bacterium]|nr:cell division protein SepF [Selenomonadaceae bacterium]
MEDAQAVTKYLREKTPVIISFEETADSEIKRIIDFISGTIYAVAGKMSPVGQKVFICAPANITVETPNESRKFL